jgi:copper chaperone
METAMKTTTFTIAGMHCDGCAENIQALLQRQQGVRTASVSFRDREARVLHDERSVPEAQVAALIEKAGFRVLASR